ncbi:unnamed protein product, partial [Ectocarpus sp. 8 AP-2014]
RSVGPQPTHAGRISARSSASLSTGGTHATLSNDERSWTLTDKGLSTAGSQPYSLGDSYKKRIVMMADGRQQQQQQRQRQRQRRRPCFRSVPAHRIIGGGLGRRYDHAALLSDHLVDDGVFDDGQYNLDRLPSDDHQR